MKKIQLYFEEAFNELFNKVTWPTWKELQSSAIVVMVASLIIGIIIFVMDYSFGHVMKFIYDMFY
jgi:preprotein translocase subunit SecE